MIPSDFKRFGAKLMSVKFRLEKAEDLHQLSGYACDHFESGGKPLNAELTIATGTGKWGMARLWRSWMSVTAEWMANNGAKMPLTLSKEGQQYGSRPFNANDAHELFTYQWLGMNEKGERLSWKKSDGVNVADKGQRFMAMLKHEQYCIERGINLPQPRDSELNELKEKQNG